MIKLPSFVGFLFVFVIVKLLLLLSVKARDEKRKLSGTLSVGK
jgi:hypothetical protein